MGDIDYMFFKFTLALFFVFIFIKVYRDCKLERYARLDERILSQSRYGDIMTDEQNRKFSYAIQGLDKKINNAMETKNYKLADYYVAVIDEVAEDIMEG